MVAAGLIGVRALVRENRWEPDLQQLVSMAARSGRSAHMCMMRGSGKETAITTRPRFCTVRRRNTILAQGKISHVV